MPVAMLGVWWGRVLVRAIDQVLFERLVIFFIIVVGLKMFLG
jgi:uncharacterized membrane protein YfcA